MSCIYLSFYVFSYRYSRCPTFPSFFKINHIDLGAEKIIVNVTKYCVPFSIIFVVRRTSIKYTHTDSPRSWIEAIWSVTHRWSFSVVFKLVQYTHDDLKVFFLILNLYRYIMLNKISKKDKANTPEEPWYSFFI